MTGFPRLTLLVASLALLGCEANRLEGTLGGDPLDPIASAVYHETRGTDPGSGLAVHDIDLWMLPFADGCAALPALLDELITLREDFNSGTLASAEDYCGAWESVFTEAVGGEPFWLSQFRLRAEPREDGSSVDRVYPWLDEDGDALASEPVFDATVARYERPDFAACAQEFEGEPPTDYAPILYPASGGTVTLSSYEADGRISGDLAPSFVDAQGGGLAGSFQADFCLGAGDWSLVFGLGERP